MVVAPTTNLRPVISPTTRAGHRCRPFSCGPVFSSNLPRPRAGSFLPCSRVNAWLHLKTDLDGHPLDFHLTGDEESDTTRSRHRANVAPTSPRACHHRQGVTTVTPIARRHAREGLRRSSSGDQFEAGYQGIVPGCP